MPRAFTRVSPLRQRFRPLWWLAITFVLISFVTRVALLVMSGKEIPHTPLNLLYAFGVGLGYDLVTFIYVAWPMVLMLWLVPARQQSQSPPQRSRAVIRPELHEDPDAWTYPRCSRQAAPMRPARSPEPDSFKQVAADGGRGMDDLGFEGRSCLGWILAPTHT